MASFSDLRPGSRSAKAGSKAVRRIRSRILLAVSAALLLTASLAVSELATLRGAKAHDASAYLTRELGSPLSSASLVRAPARNVHVGIRKGGFDLEAPEGSLSVVASGAGAGEWRHFEHGALRTIGIGEEAVTVHGDAVEESLRVLRHHGRRIWRWRLDSRLDPRLANGVVAFFDGRRMVNLQIDRVKILDDEGDDVTPKGVHWSLARRGKTNWLELTLDDSKLETPYTIDPAVLRTSGTFATGNGTFNVGIPAGVQTGDLLVLLVSQAVATVPAAPTGWSTVPNSGGTVGGSGTKLGSATFYRKGLAADASTNVSVTTTAAGLGQVFVYRGVDTTLPGTICPGAACMIRDAALAPTGNNTSTTITFTSLTTSMASEEVVGVGAALANVNWPATSTTGSFTRRSPANANNGSTISQGLYDKNVASIGAVTGTVNIVSNVKNLGFMFGLANDTTNPTSGSETIGGISPAGVAYQPSAGGIFYYNGNVAGQFTISDPITDAESGPQSVTYPAVATSGWTHALETVSTGTSYTSSAYQWNANTHTAPSAAERTLSEKDNGDNTVTSNIVSIVDDSTAPAGGALSVNGTAASSGGATVYDTDGSFSIDSRSDYTETQSAIASGLVSSTLVRTSASFSSADVCGSFGSPTTLVGTPAQSGLATGCYKYTLTGTDNVGNTVSISTTVKVDTSDPSAPSFSFANLSGGAYYSGSGTRVYFKPDAASGSFDVTGSATDNDTGIASYSFPAGSAIGTNWSGAGTGATRTYSYTATATTNGAQSVTATNNAGRTGSSASFDVTADSTPPAGGALSVNGSAASSGGSSSYDTDGSFSIDSRTDYSETQSATAAGLASSTLVRTSASFSSADVCGSFASPTTLVGTPAQSGLSTGCYRYTLTGTDNVGNTVSISTTVKVDTSDPTLSLTLSNATGAPYIASGRAYFRPGATGGGSFDVSGAGTDSDTGIVSYAFPSGATLGSNWSASGSGSSRTYTYTPTATSNGTQTVSTTNNAGRTGNATFDLVADSTPPAGGALSVNASAASSGGSSSYDTDGSFSIDSRTDYSETQNASAAGLASATLVRTSASFSSPDVCGGFGSPTTLVGTPAQSGLATGCYRYTLTGTDNVGNTISISTTVKVDTSAPSAPTLSLSNALGGAYYPGSGTRVYFKPGAATGGFDVSASSSDNDSDIASYGFPAGAALGANWSASGSGSSRTYSYTATATTTGTQSVSAVNNAGGSASSTFDLTDDSTAPSGGVLTVNGGAMWSTSGSFPIDVRTDYSETQSATESGLVASTLVRESATLTNNSCGSFGSATTIVGAPAQSLPTGCYRYTLTGTDNVGNTATITATVKVDTSDPSAPTFSFSNFTGSTSAVGNVVMFLPTGSGSFDITASSADGDSAIGGYTFPTAASFGSGWSVSGSGNTRTYSYVAGAATPGSQTVTAANNAGRTASANFSVVVSDTTAPTTTIQCNGAACQGSWYTTSPVSVTLSADDGAGGSGVDMIRYTLDGSDPTPVNGADYIAPIDIVATTTVKFRAYDNLGNEEAVASQLVRVDATPPSGQSITLTGAGAPYYTSTSVTFTTGNGSDAESGLDPSTATVTRETGDLNGNSCSNFSADGGTFASPDNTVTGGHCYRYRFTIADNVGNVSAPVTATAKIDLDDPAVTLTDPGTPVAGVVSLSASASDSSTAITQVVFERSPAGAGTWTAIDTDTSAPYGASWNTGGVADGLYDLRAIATDTVGHTKTDVASSRRVDNTSPDTSVDSGPADPSNDTTPTFAFSSTEAGSTFQCRVDGGGWSSCTSPHTTSALGAGSHTFDTRATDAAGNTDPTPASFTWTIDLTAPNTTIDSSPADPSANATPSFTFSSSESGSTFECRVDGGSWSTCTSPHTTSALGDGSHTFEVRATDAAGNTDATPASHTWTVDLTAPQTTIDSSPSSPSNDTTPTFSFSSSETGSTFQCRVDSGGWSSCTSPETTSALGAGSHTFDVRATDVAGNTDGSPASFTWTIDLTAPNTTLDSGPANPSNDTTPTFTFSATEPGSSFECRIDGGGWSSCASPETTSALGAGSHTFDVRASDPAGNTDGTPASQTWTIDLTAPNTTIDSAPPALDNDATPTFAFSSSEGGSTFECRVDGGSWTSCTSPHTTSALSEGSHTFDVRATDPAGNPDATPASHTWSIDLGPPSVTITAPTTYVNGSDPSTYAVTATTPDGDVDHVVFYECSNGSTACSTGSWTQFDSDSSAPYSGSWSTPGADSTRAIRAVAVDTALNTGEDVKTITIDRTPPGGVSVSYPNNYVFGSFAVTTSSGPDGDVDASTATLERKTGDLANDGCSNYGGWSAASSPDTLASGKCAQYRFRIADNAGNWTTATSGNEAKSDTNAPASAQDDPGANLRQTVSLSSSASDTGGSGLASVAFQRRPAGGGSWTTIATDTGSPYSTSFDTTSVGDGLYDFRTVATDVAGNAEASPVVVANRRIDNTAPSATMVSPGNPVRGTVALTSTTSDSGSGVATVAYELAPNGGSFNTQPASWDTTLGADGLYDLRVTATDAAGNSTTSAVVTTRIDNTAPALTFSSPATGATVSGTVSLTASASDASPASPAVTFAYKLSSDPPSAYTATGASWNTTALPGGDGVYDLRARATDDASNTTTVENTSIRVDNVAPSIAITAPAAAINGSLPSPTSFSATASDPGGSGVTQVQFFECSNQSNDCSTGVWSPLGTVAAPGPYSVSWNIPAVDGNYALAAVATDNAGHPSTDIRNVSVDRTAPQTTITGKPADPSNAASPTFTFSSSESGSTFECSVDGSAFAPCTSPHSVSGLNDNAHTFDVRATDAAGNTDASPDTWTWHRDTNNPAGTLSSPGANIRQTVSLSSTESDPAADGYASGLASVDYQYSADGSSWAAIGTLSSAPYDSILWNTTSVADGVYQLRIVVHDVAGNAAPSAAVTNVRVDNTPPTTSHDDPGQYLRATKTLSGSAADSGSGIDHVDFQRAQTGGGSWTTIASDPTAPYSTSFDTTTVADGHYDFRTVAYDVAGNQAAATPVTDRLVDNTPPNATLNDPGAYLHGAVSLTSSTSDPGGANASGVVGVAYEYSTNGGTTWQPTGSTFDSTSVADGNVQLHVVATDAAGNTAASAPVTKLVDNTKPSTSDDAPAGWRANPVTVTLTPSDAGSGVNVTEYSVDGNPTYTVGTSVAIPAPADGSNDGAHTIAYFSVDNAGNIESVKSATVLIDATPPACPSCSAADYLRGTVTLSADPDAGGSGIQSVAFQYTDAGGSTWTTIATDTTAPYAADWDTTAVADGHYDLRIRITDNANNVTTADLPDKVVDNTAPDVATVGAPTESQIVTGTVAIAASAADVTSPVASVQFFVRGSSVGTDTTAPFTYSWNTASGPDGAATIHIVVTDMAGNSTTSATRNVTVDNVTPTPTLADPGQNLSGTVSLNASSDGDTVQVDFERRPAGGGSWTTIASDSALPWGTSLDTTTLTDGLYDFRAVATDGTGHVGTSPLRANVRVDNTAPSGSLTSPTSGSTVGGTSVPLSASVSDAGSGVASVAYELRPTGGGAFSQVASSSTAPFGATWDATTVTSGSYDMRPVISDRAGNTFTGAVVTFDVDVTAPTVTLSNPGATIFGTITLNATVSGNGPTSVTFGATPAGGATWTSLGSDTSSPWSVTYDTTKLADGVYDLRATVTDNLGNSSQDVVTGVRVDNTAPRVVSSSPADGSTVGSANSISLVASEPATPVGVTLDGGATVAPVISGTTIAYNTGALAAGPHTLAGELQDASGKKAPFRIHFTVGSGAVEKNTSSSSATTVTSADGFGAATMPAGAWSTSSNDWIVLRIAPAAAPSGLTNGFAPGPEALDVTAWWALSGTQLHELAQPAEIVMHSSERGLVPATFENGAWRIIHRVPTAGTLPTGWSDGFFGDASGLHVLTRHLSLFALLRDVEAPQAPLNVRGYVGPTGLTIRWLPGNDNSGTYDFVTLFSDSTDAGHYGPDFTAATVAGWKPGDSRIFRLQETDLAGNESALTAPLVPVPSLLGMTSDQAEAALRARGLSIGSVTVGGSGKPGTVTGPEGLVLAGQGSEIDLTVAPGGASTSLVFKVITAPRFKPALRKKMAARLTVTRAARVTAQLFSPRRVQLYTWRFSVHAGRTILKLKIPTQVRRPGIYTMRWSARAGRETVTRTVRIRIVGSVAPAQRVGIVLAGTAAQNVDGTLGRQKPKVVTAVEPTFDAAANRNRDVRVIVVDVDEFGVGIVRDLHIVFPATKIVALAAGPKTMAAALKAGATIVLPRSTPPATLAKIVRRLAKRR